MGRLTKIRPGPTELEMMRRILARQGYALWLELRFEGPAALPGLPAADSAEALRRGLVRIDSQGRPDGPAVSSAEPRSPRSDEAAGDQGLAELKAGEPGSAGADW